MREGVRTARETARPKRLIRVQDPAQARIGFEFKSGVVVVLELGAERERQIAAAARTSSWTNALYRF